MIDRRLKRRLFWGAILGLVAGSIWVAMRPPPLPSYDHGFPAPQIIVGAHPTTTTRLDHPTPPPAPTWAVPAGMLDTRLAEAVDGRLQQRLDDDTTLTYTLSPPIQKAADQILRNHKVEWGAVVALRPATGEILALSEYIHGDDHPGRLALISDAPAASIFKLITSAALLEKGTVKPDTEICTHGGRNTLSLYHLKDSAKRDTHCETFSEALGSSNNVAFARWADRHLDARKFDDLTHRFLFGHRIPYLWAVGISRAHLPSASRLGFARTAAGFENTTLSPLHAALITAAIAYDGTMMAPHLIAKAERHGELLFEAQPTALTSPLESHIARQLAQMMESTMTTGTASKFFNKDGKPYLPARSGGKSGSLSGKQGGATRHYSWFVAFAPLENPEIAVAALIVNGEQWTIKGVTAARAVLKAHFDAQAAAAD